MGCNCPEATALTVIAATTCPDELGQILRLIFVRKNEVIWDTVTPVNNVPASISGDAPTATVASTEGWSILIPAADSTKTILSPLVGGDPVINPGDQVTFGGGDNSTRNGQIYHVAFNPADGSFRFDSFTAQQTYEMKLLICEDLEVYMINADGDIIGHRDRDAAGVNEDTWHGFPVSNVAMGGRSVQGFATRDSNVLTLQLNDDWDSHMEKQTPTDFNALTFVA